MVVAGMKARVCFILICTELVSWCSAFQAPFFGSSLRRLDKHVGCRALRGRCPMSDRGTLNVLKVQASVTVDSETESSSQPAANSFVPPTVSSVAWRDAGPQRNLEGSSTEYLNQFPNTWQPAESLVRAKVTAKETDGYISTAGLELKVASCQKTYDVAIVGTGPAGLALAAELGAQGLSVAVVGPIRGGWPNNYGVWLDEWKDLDLPDNCLEETYSSTRITISSQNSISIPRKYGKVSGPKTREVLLKRCAERGVEVRESMVETIEHSKGRTEPALLHCENDDPISAKVPIVAAGHYSPLVKYSSPGVEFLRLEGEYMTRTWDPLLQIPADQRIIIEQENVPSVPVQTQSWRESVQRDSVRPGQHAWGWNWGWNVVLRGIKIPEIVPGIGGLEPMGGGAPGYQIAYGITIDCSEGHGFPLDEMLLMDFSTDHLKGENMEGHTPSFLYAFAFDDKKVFLQETLLVARNYRAKAESLEMEEMVRRLNLRIVTMNLKVVRRYDEECSVIPMGGPLPVLGQPTVAYGASAIMVHPASGYMINRVLKYAPEVAVALADTLKSTGSPQKASEAAWEAVWPKHRLIERDLYCFGMEVMLDLDIMLLREFFEAFFANPQETWWRKFLAWDMTKPGEKPYSMSVFMILMFFRGSWTLKGRLVKEAMFKDGLHLLKSIFDMPFPFD